VPQAAYGGDIEEYVRVRTPALLRTAYLLTTDVHAAEDLVQTVLAKLWPRWQRLSTAGDPDAYVRRCLVNTFLSWRRRRAATELVLSDPPERSAPARHDQDSVGTRLLVLGALGQLPPRQRATVVLRFFNDLSEGQVAELMGCGIGTLKSR
jgi:RNA polymerase sigma-70 factor (sigma-E family)